VIFCCSKIAENSLKKLFPKQLLRKKMSLFAISIEVIIGYFSTLCLYSSANSRGVISTRSSFQSLSRGFPVMPIERAFQCPSNTNVKGGDV
jgi:hypothetical protein